MIQFDTKLEAPWDTKKIELIRNDVSIIQGNTSTCYVQEGKAECSTHVVVHTS